MTSFGKPYTEGPFWPKTEITYHSESDSCFWPLPRPSPEIGLATVLACKGQVEAVSKTSSRKGLGRGVGFAEPLGGAGLRSGNPVQGCSLRAAFQESLILFLGLMLSSVSLLS